MFELHDQAWLPVTFRNALTEWLRVVWEYSQAAEVIAPLLARVLEQSGAKRIVDLCSGGTGPILPILRNLQSLNACRPVLATDKFPNVSVMANLEKETNGLVTGSLQSWDATSLPDTLTGLRTLFNSFHHFSPAQAREILAGASRSGQPIGVFEITERTIPKVLLCFPASFLSVFFLIGRMRPHRTAWWLFTWLLPIIPAVIAWDGLVSHLRSYTEAELLGLIGSLDDKNYSWEMGRIPTPRGGLEVSFLLGRSSC